MTKWVDSAQPAIATLKAILANRSARSAKLSFHGNACVNRREHCDLAGRRGFRILVKQPGFLGKDCKWLQMIFFKHLVVLWMPSLPRMPFGVPLGLVQPLGPRRKALSSLSSLRRKARKKRPTVPKLPQHLGQGPQGALRFEDFQHILFVSLIWYLGFQVADFWFWSCCRSCQGGET